MSASLQARHSRKCGKGWTTFEDAKGCDCAPTYYVRARVDGKLASERIGKNRREAERALTKARVKVDEGSYLAPSQLTFREWAREWEKGLTVRDSTLADYRSTIGYANDAFGDRKVRDLRVSDLRAFLNALPVKSETTKAKHLRNVTSCLRAAVIEGHLVAVPELARSQRPRNAPKEISHYTDDEIERLLPEIPEGVYRVLTETALKTGARQGELLALRWGDLNLLEGTARISRSWSMKREGPTKGGKGRTAYLLGDLPDILGAWWGELGHPEEDVLVFPGTAKEGHLDPHTIRRNALYPALRRAGIERQNRTFHSLRHTFARRALEGGAPIVWVKEQLGHSSITLTVDRYGRWEQAARKTEAEKLAEAFSG